MKNLLKLAAMLMCVVGMVAVVSCSKDDDEVTIDDIKGTKWKCTYSIQDPQDTYTGQTYAANAYVGTEWYFSNERVPYESDEFYLYKNGVKGNIRYVVYPPSHTISRECSELGIFDYDPFADDPFTDLHYKLELKNGNKELVLSYEETNYDGSRSYKVYLRFKKI